MNRGICLATLLAFAPASRAQEAAESIVGKDAPRFETGEWFNHPKVAPESLDGRVVVYAFVRVSERESLLFLEDWVEFQMRFAGEPIAFFAVTDEAPDDVRKAIEIERLRAPIVLDPTDTAPPAFGVQRFPSVAVVGGDRRVRYVAAAEAEGDHGSLVDAIVGALGSARYLPELPKPLAPVQRHVDRWKMGIAYLAFADAKERAKDDATKRLAADLMVLFERATGDMARAAAEAAAAEDWPRAITLWTRVAEEHEDIPGSEDASRKIDELAARPGLLDEIEAAKLYAQAERYERDRAWGRAASNYTSITKRYPETKAGKQAQARAEYAASRE